MRSQGCVKDHARYPTSNQQHKSLRNIGRCMNNESQTQYLFRARNANPAIYAPPSTLLPFILQFQALAILKDAVKYGSQPKCLRKCQKLILKFAKRGFLFYEKIVFICYKVQF